MRGCEVCGGKGGQRCGGCGNVSYCGQNHQRQHWSEHKLQCSPFKVKHSDDLGNYLVAGKYLNPGDLILDEEVYVLGPSDDKPTAMCLGCYYPSHGYQCQRCGSPLCGPRCSVGSAHSEKECEILAREGVGNKLSIEWQTYSIIVVPLRLIILNQSEPARYKKCLSLSTNLDLRRQQEVDFKETEKKVRIVVSLFLEVMPSLDVSHEDVLNIFCILDTNAFQVLASGCAENLSGLYPRVALLNHSCVPNCRLVFKADYSLQVRASTSMKKGSTIFISYTPPFYSLLTRRAILQRGKQFVCLCERCCHPTELGTFLSSVHCDTCNSGYLQAVTPCSPNSTTWQCNSCQNSWTSDQFSKLNSQLLAVQTNMDKEDVRGMKAVINKYSARLHPNHALLTETKQHLTSALGRVDGYRYDQLSNDDLQLKVDLSYDLLSLCSMLEPGISKSRGITLLDLTETRARIVMEQEGDILPQLREIEIELEEAHSILMYEDEKAIEGNVAKQARQQLDMLRKHIARRISEKNV